MSITAYFTKYRTLTDELNALSPLPKYTYTTTNCSYRVRAKLNSLGQFLMDLSKAYTAIRGQILLMQPLPTLSQVYSLLLLSKSRSC